MSGKRWPFRHNGASLLVLKKVAPVKQEHGDSLIQLLNASMGPDSREHVTLPLEHHYSSTAF